MEIIPFTELITDCTKEATKLPKSTYQETGTTAIVDQGQDFIAGYTDESDGIFTKTPAIIFGDHTRVFKYVDFPFFIGADGVKVLKATRKINYKYLYYYFLQAKFPNTGYARHFKWLKELKIPVPSLEEQNNIAAQLDKCTILIENYKQLLLKYDELIKSRFIEMFGDPVQNPMKWEKKNLSEWCTKVTDGTHDTPPRYTSGVLLLTGKNIRADHIDFSEIEYVSPEDHKIIYERCNPEYGDVLYTNIGVNYGTAVLNTIDYQFSMKNIALLKPKRDLVSGYYLWFVLNLLRNKILDENKTGGAQTFMSLATIRNLIIPMPPISLQNDFASFVQQLDKSKFTIQQSLEKIDCLFNSLLQEYFDK